MALKEVDENIHGHVASDGVEALAKLTKDLEFIPDYIFLDVNMPKMNGPECLSAIKQLVHLKQQMQHSIKFIRTHGGALHQITKVCRLIVRSVMNVNPG